MRPHSPMVIHYVRDMERACAFYREVLGLTDSPTPGSGSPGWNTFHCDGLIIALHILPAGESAEGPMPHAGLNLEVDDLDAALAELQAAGGELRALHGPAAVYLFAWPRLPTPMATVSSCGRSSADSECETALVYPAHLEERYPCSQRSATPST